MKLKGKLEPKVLEDISQYGFKIEYESEHLKYQTIQNRKYIPDFVVTLPDGRKIYLEVKGYFRPDDTAKLRRVKETHPDKDIRLVFDKDNKFSSKSPMRYSDWCNKYQFQYCVGNVPKGWFE